MLLSTLNICAVKRVSQAFVNQLCKHSPRYIVRLKKGTCRYTYRSFHPNFQSISSFTIFDSHKAMFEHRCLKAQNFPWSITMNRFCNLDRYIQKCRTSVTRKAKISVDTLIQIEEGSGAFRWYSNCTIILNMCILLLVFLIFVGVFSLLLLGISILRRLLL